MIKDFSRLSFKLFATFIVLSTLMNAQMAFANKEAPVKIIFLGESSSKDSVWLYRVERMNQAAQKLPNVEFSYRFAQGNYQHHVKMIEEAVNEGVDAIIIPMWDPLIYNDAITKVVNKGIYVYSMLGTGPKQHLSHETIKKMGWAQTNWYEFGKRLAKVSLKKNPHATHIYWPAEMATGSYITDAVAGFKAAYAQKGLDINIDVIEVGFDTKIVTKKIKYYLNAHPEVKTIVTSGAIAIDAANRAVKEMKIAPENIVLIGQVISPKSVQGIIEGFMVGGVNLELTNSSEHAVLESFNVIKHKSTPSQKSVDFVEVTKKNVTQVVPLTFLKTND